MNKYSMGYLIAVISAIIILFLLLWALGLIDPLSWFVPTTAPIDPVNSPELPVQSQPAAVKNAALQMTPNLLSLQSITRPTNRIVIQKTAANQVASLSIVRPQISPVVTQVVSKPAVSIAAPVVSKPAVSIAAPVVSKPAVSAPVKKPPSVAEAIKKYKYVTKLPKNWQSSSLKYVCGTNKKCQFKNANEAIAWCNEHTSCIGYGYDSHSKIYQTMNKISANTKDRTFYKKELLK